MHINVTSFLLTDIDECKTMNVCGAGKCVNRNGSYNCSCNKGYAETEMNGKNTCKGT